MYTMVAAPIEDHVLGETEDQYYAQQARFASGKRGDRWATSDTWSGELLPQRNYSGKNNSKSREKNGILVHNQCSSFCGRVRPLKGLAGR